MSRRTPGDEVEFRLNGDTVATVPVGTERNFVAEADVPYEPGILEVSYRDGAEVGRSALRTAGEPAPEPRDGPHRTPRRSTAVGPHRTLDRRQAGCSTPATTMITIEVDGPGVLQGFGTGAPATEEGFRTNSCTTYKGRALAVLRSTGDSGHVKVRALAAGLPDATLQIEVTEGRQARLVTRG